MQSLDYYRTSAPASPPFAPLSGTCEADVCIVGAGFAGLNTALGLAERGVRGVMVLDADSIAYGASGRNGGFVFSGYSPGEAALLAGPGAAQAKSLYRGTQEAVDLIRARIGQYGIACSHTDAGVLWANWFRDPAPLRERLALLSAHFDTQWEWVPRETLATLLNTSRYSDALFEPNAMHFNPLAYARGVAAAAAARGVAVHEYSPALALERDGEGWRVRTAQGQVRARQVVLACGGYLAGLRREVDASILPIATYVMVTEPLGERLAQVIATRAAIYDSRYAFDYYRPLPDTRLLWGGRISVRDRSPRAVRQLLRRDMLKVYPQLEDVGIEFAWSGLMSYARHQMPQVGRVDQGLWLAQAFGGHGVAPTTFAGELLAAAIAHDDRRWRDFSRFGLVSAAKPAGFLAAQLSYWWYQAKDAWNDRAERLAG
jgi:gamma-glutamylputrescine oxidase